MAKTFPFFIDIETVPSFPDWNKLDERTADVYYRKFRKQIDDLADEGDAEPFVTHYADNAAMYAEFGRIVCVCVGVVTSDLSLRIRTIAYEGPESEKRILIELKKTLAKAPFLCAHNGFEFDFTFLQRKYMIHDIDLPDTLNTMGKKPWDVMHKDTLNMWKFGQYKYFASLESIANSFGLPSPKADMDGSMVAEVYYSTPPEGVLIFDHLEAVLKRIGSYCATDVVTLANVYMRLEREPMITPDKITFVEEPKPAQQSLPL